MTTERIQAFVEKAQEHGKAVSVSERAVFAREDIQEALSIIKELLLKNVALDLAGKAASDELEKENEVLRVALDLAGMHWKVEETSRCTICQKVTDLACSDCRIDLQSKVFVCESSYCRDTHEKKCPLSLSERIDKLVERSVGAMAIAEGDEDYEKISIDCPMLVAVSKLRSDYDELECKNTDLWKVLSWAIPTYFSQIKQENK